MVAENITQNSGILRSDLRLYPAGQPRQWTLHDPVVDRYYRLGHTEYQVLSRLHDNIPLDKLQSQLAASGCNVSFQEIIALLGFLSSNGLMLPVYGKSHQRVRAMHAQLNAGQRQRLFGSWLYMRFALLRPEPFLNRTWPLLRPLLQPGLLWFLCALALSGYLLVLLRWPQLKAVFHQSLSPQGFVRYGLVIAVVKIFHELAHAYAAKWAGVPVRNMGLGLMVFLPRLYTDVTDSWRIGDRRKRMIIDGAGMGVELILGGIAGLIWANTGPGILNGLCYYLVGVSAFNTLLINGNPLLRYDGYYLLMDATGIDNLSTRALTQLKNWYRSFFFGIAGYPSSDSPLIRWLLIGYGISSSLYRVFIYSGLLYVLTSTFFPLLSLVFTSLGVITLIFRPLIMEGHLVFRQKAHMQHGRTTLSALLLLGVICLFLLPLPWNLEIPCVVRSEQVSTLFVAHPGYIKTVISSGNAGQAVRQGEVIYALQNPLLQLNLKEIQLQIHELRMATDQLNSGRATLGLAKIKEEHLHSLEVTETEIKNNLEALTVRAPIDGTLVWYAPEELETGRWLPQGVRLGEVYRTESKVIQAFLPEVSLSGIHEGQHADIIFPDKITKVPGTVRAIQRIPVKNFMISPLLDVFGGPVPVKRQGTEFSPQHVWYGVLIDINSNDVDATFGRSGVVRLERYRSLAASLGRLLLEMARRDVF
ncbi:MAG: HlyD family efflux transporter periplasmic adaptor subunit [Pseudomonadota bacterium]